MNKLKRLPNEPVYDIGLTSHELELIMNALFQKAWRNDEPPIGKKLHKLANRFHKEWTKTLNI